MPAGTPRERLRAAQSRVGGARAVLREPAKADAHHCEALLREACEELATLVEALRGAAAGDAELRQNAMTLRREIQQVGALLEQAARFGRQWLERLGAAQGGYTPAGAAAPVLPRGCVSVAG